MLLSSGTPAFSQQFAIANSDSTGSCTGTFTESTLDFGTVLVTQTSSFPNGYNVCICGSCYSATNPAKITGISVTGANPGDFPLSTDTCTGFSFTDPNCNDCTKSGHFCTVQNVLEPSALGARSAAVNLNATYKGTPFVSCTWGTTGTGGFGILKPYGNFPLSSPTSVSDPGWVTMPFQAAAGATDIVSWSNQLNYGLPLTGAVGPTTGCLSVAGPLPPPDAFGTTGSQTTIRTYSGVGGKATVSASTGPYNANAFATISGTTIANCLISQKLASLYPSVYSNVFPNTSPPTPDLLERIGCKESTYHQFTQQTQQCYQNLSALWPNTPSGGGAVGLMQVGTAYADAWNWIVNTGDGASTFQQKLSTAQTYVNSQLANCPGLAPFSQATQLEDEALSAHGGWLKACGDPTNSTQCGGSGGYYWQPVRVNGTWQWAQNTACVGVNSSLVQYVNGVRAEVPWPTDCANQPSSNPGCG